MATPADDRDRGRGDVSCTKGECGPAVPARPRTRHPPARLAVRLVVTPASDDLESDADATAERVMGLLRRSAPLFAADHPGRIQRVATPHGVEVGPEGGPVSDQIAGRIQRGLRPLDEGIRRVMEPAFGADLSSVRVNPASDLAPRLGAAAFTVGSNIHFAPGNFEPQSTAGQRLLAHELAHTVQHRSARSAALHRYWACGNPKGEKCKDQHVYMGKDEKPEWACSVCGQILWTWKGEKAEAAETEQGGKVEVPTGPKLTREQEVIRNDQDTFVGALSALTIKFHERRAPIKKLLKFSPTLPTALLTS